MISFRKTFLLLAVLVAVAGLASAQSFSCAVNAGAPTIARQEGVAEEVGQVLLSCSGGTQTAAGVNVGNSVNIQIFLNTQVTSRLLTSDGWSESLVLIDEPQPTNLKFCGSAGFPINTTTGTCPVIGTTAGTSPYATVPTNPNVYQGKYNSAVPNSMSFNGIPLDAPGTGPVRTLRIVNIRANASAITSSSFIPGNITMFIAITGTGAPGIGNNAQQVVGFVQKGFGFSLRDVDGGDFSRLDLSQCNGNNSDATATDGAGCVDFRVRFSELFGTAFRPQYTRVGGVITGAIVPQDQISQVYNSEGMFYNTGWPTLTGRGNLARAGVATQATQLRATFTNIPAGVRIFVTDFNASSESIEAQRTDGTDLKSGSVDCNWDDDESSSTYTEITAAGNATWNINTAEPSISSDVDFGVLVYFTPTGVTPTTSPIQVTGNYNPINTQSPIMAALGSDDSTSGHPLPRFVSSGITPIDAVTIVPCRTNLLFTFVTNQAGFDTGLAISNTSSAPTGFAGSPQSGACTLNYYGITTGGGAAPAVQTSASVPAGGQLVFTLSGGGGILGGSPSVNPTPGFQGYIIAQCNFQYAHGFAFVSDIGATKLAEGYLALILDSPISHRSGSASESLSN